MRTSKQQQQQRDTRLEHRPSSTTRGTPVRCQPIPKAGTRNPSNQVARWCMIQHTNARCPLLGKLPRRRAWAPTLLEPAGTGRFGGARRAFRTYPPSLQYIGVYSIYSRCRAELPSYPSNSSTHRSTVTLRALASLQRRRAQKGSHSPHCDCDCVEGDSSTTHFTEPHGSRHAVAGDWRELRCLYRSGLASSDRRAHRLASPRLLFRTGAHLCSVL
jgi:hypothetical protein